MVATWVKEVDDTVTPTAEEEDRGRPPRRKAGRRCRRLSRRRRPALPFPRLYHSTLLFVLFAVLRVVYYRRASPAGDYCGALLAVTAGVDAFRLEWGGIGSHPKTCGYAAKAVDADSRGRPLSGAAAPNAAICRGIATSLAPPRWRQSTRSRLGVTGAGETDDDEEGGATPNPNAAGGVGYDEGGPPPVKVEVGMDDSSSRPPDEDDDRDVGDATMTPSSSNNREHRKRKRKRRRFIPPEEVERIKSEVDLVEFIQHYADPPLERFVTTSGGRRATAICPFHDDTNPSLHVDSDRGLYGCFACGAAGDVFNFVREYDLVTGGGGGSGDGSEKMGFHEAVEIVRDYVETGGGGGGVKWTPSPTSKSRTRKKAAVSEKKKKRILLANAAAAAFYHRNLISLPGAGAARSHLRARGLRPSTVRAFCLGYAPDAYFGPGSRLGRTRTRVGGGGGGVEGSLVQHLRGLRFTAEEIVDAGLATRTARTGPKGGDGKVGAKATVTMLDGMNRTDASTGLLAAAMSDGKASSSENVTASTGGGGSEDTRRTNNEKLRYDELMDRFRNRLIVPIFDGDGASVIALGGRHLDAPMESTTTTTPRSASTTRMTDHGGGGATLDHPQPRTDDETMIESAAMTKTAFRPAKYINSPESAVFSKKRCLFGIHAARASLSANGGDGAVNDAGEGMDVYHPSTVSPMVNAWTGREDGADWVDDGWSDRRKRERRLVIVEGYLDAVVLHDAGVAETVACMGTALSAEQLSLAAEAVVDSDGDAGVIILCLDADEAGTRAVERLCESMVISEVLDKFDGLEILVATMPEGVKDPAEFIEKGSGGKADHDADVDIGCVFRREILDGAMQWSDWYLLRLVARYEQDGCITNDAANSNGSRADSARLAEVCDAVSDFISIFDDPSDRARHAGQAAHALVMKFIGRDGASGSPSPSALRIQLESDIMDLSVRKARGKALARKIESASREKGKSLSGRGKAEIMSKLTRGESTAGDDYAEFEPIVELGKRGAEDSFPSQRSSSEGALVARHRRRWSKGEKRSAVPQPALVPHFSGFEFANSNDVHWLGLESKQGGLLLGMNSGKSGPTKHNGNAFMASGNNRLQRGRTVYFNSNEYLGYNDCATYFDPGIPGPMEDPERILLACEERLLRHLVEHSPARNAMKAALTMSLKSNNSNASDFIEWSSPEREWLFHCLVDVDHRHCPLPVELRDGGTVMQLREHLSARQDAPIGAFYRNLTANSHREINSSPFDAFPAAVLVDDRLNASSSRNAEVVGDTPHNGVEEFAEDARAVTVNECGTKDSTIHAEVVTTDDVDSSDVQEGRVPNGTLEIFFFRQQEDDDDFFDLPDAAMARDMRADMVVQETLATILRARAARRMHETKTRWHNAMRASLTRGEAGQDVERNVDIIASTELNEKVDGSTSLESMDGEQLHEHCDRLGTALGEATRTTRELSDAARRMGSRFLDYSSSCGISFAHSVAKEEELAKMVDEFVADLPEDTHIPDSPGGDGRYVFGSDEYDDLINPLYGGRRSGDVALEEDPKHEPTPFVATEDALPEDGLVDMMKRATQSDGASPRKFDDDDDQRILELVTTTSSEEEEEMVRLLDDYISGLPEDALGSDDDEDDDVVESSDRELQQHRFERVIRARRAKESQPGTRKPGRGWAWTASGWAWNPLSFDHISSEEEDDAEDTP